MNKPVEGTLEYFKALAVKSSNEDKRPNVFYTILSFPGGRFGMVQDFDLEGPCEILVKLEARPMGSYRAGTLMA